MELREIDEKTYNTFALKNKYISIYQLPEWGKLKEENGWKYYLIGLFDKEKVIGVTLLLSKNTPIKKSLFYSPRGYLIDVNNFNLLKEFNSLVIDFIKKHNGFMLKVDPNVIYTLRDSDGNIKETLGKEALDNFNKVGFKHLGFNMHFEGLQPRWLCRFELKEDYEKTLDTFTKTTRKNIAKTVENGVKVRPLDVSEIEIFSQMWQETADKRNVAVRPSSYYKKMYELMHKYVTFYVTYIDTEQHYKSVESLLNNTKKELENLLTEMKKINVGDKILKKKNDLENKIKKLEIELTEANELRKIGPQINIGTLQSVYIGDEGITFMSGTSTKYHNFSPKYAYYNAHIIESLKRKLKYVNFYGISGDLNKDNPYYAMYEIKRGFNPDIVELIGEFDYIINRFDYRLYKIALYLYNLKKKLKKRLKK